jgi:hypothetical protein
MKIDHVDVERCCRLRDHLYATLTETSVWTESQLGYVHVRCRDLIKSIPSSAQEALILLHKLGRTASHTRRRITLTLIRPARRSCRAGPSATTNRFWKRSGHPLLPVNPDLADLRHVILDADRSALSMLLALARHDHD